MTDRVIEPINLEGFEKLAYTLDGTPQSFEAAARELANILQKVRQDSGFFGLNDPEVQLPVLYTRLAGAITVLLAHPKFTLTPDGFVHLCQYHPILHGIFRASGYETMDHVLATIGRRPAQDSNSINFDGNAVVVLLLCWSLDSEVDVDLEALAKMLPDYVGAAMLGILGAGGTFSKKSYERRLRLMSLRHLIQNADMHEKMLGAAGDCYMHCSYTDAPDKHELKRVINDRVRSFVVKTGKIYDLDRPLARKARPTIIVPLEWFHHGHAMYRCYAPSLLQLRAQFRLVGLGRRNEIDDTGRAVFDKMIEIPSEQMSVQTIFEAIRDEAPEIIFYPSVGMAAWYVALSNFRLAPIQICSPGHPASTLSRVMDYMVSDGDLFGDPSHYTEQLVKLPVGGARYIAREGFAPPEKPAPSKVFKVAVSAMAIKIVPPFLEALQRIQDRATREFEFHFFPNQISTAHWLITKDLRRWFPKAAIWPRDHYDTYMRNLAACDMGLSTFPFGGTNSTIDLFFAKVPVLCWEGTQIHERSDASMIRRVGLTEDLITHSTEEYVARAVEFIDRVRPLPPMPSFERVRDEFYGEGPISVRNAFLNAFSEIYERELDEQEKRVSESARRASSGA